MPQLDRRPEGTRPHGEGGSLLARVEVVEGEPDALAGAGAGPVRRDPELGALGGDGPYAPVAHDPPVDLDAHGVAAGLGGEGDGLVRGVPRPPALDGEREPDRAREGRGGDDDGAHARTARDPGHDDVDDLPGPGLEGPVDLDVHGMVGGRGVPGALRVAGGRVGFGDSAGGTPPQDPRAHHGHRRSRSLRLTHAIHPTHSVTPLL